MSFQTSKASSIPNTIIAVFGDMNSLRTKALALVRAYPLVNITIGRAREEVSRMTNGVHFVSAEPSESGALSVDDGLAEASRLLSGEKPVTTTAEPDFNEDPAGSNRVRVSSSGQGKISSAASLFKKLDPNSELFDNAGPDQGSDSEDESSEDEG